MLGIQKWSGDINGKCEEYSIRREIAREREYVDKGCWVGKSVDKEWPGTLGTS